jgi:aminopeptidase N
MVSWRSYRDQWLSEGFAEYSGLMYVLLRDSLYSQKEMLKTMRYQLTQPPRTDTGVGKGMVAEVGPMILGRRLRTRNTTNAYQQLTYDKGALVLRMLHYIFSNPSTGDDTLFREMMRDFTTRFQGQAASTNDFIAVANMHFPKTVLAQMLGLENLGWFFQQWVYEAKLPSYRMEYSVGKDAGGQTVITGKMIQKNAGEKWFMPLPLVLEFPGDQKATVMVWANGPETALQIPPLPMEPNSVKLDPDMWILSEKTEEKKK